MLLVTPREIPVLGRIAAVFNGVVRGGDRQFMLRCRLGNGLQR